MFKDRDDMVKAIYKRTNGMLDIQHHNIGEFPFSASDMLTMTGNGSIQMSNPSFSYFEGESAVASIMGWPMLASTNEEMDKILKVASPWLKKYYDKKGVMELTWWSNHGMAFFGTGKPAKDLSGLKGRKVRLYSVALTDLFLNYKCVPVTMSLSEVIPSLQKGVLDAAFTGSLIGYLTNYNEVTNWALLLNNIAGPCIIAVNTKAFNDLPSEIQKIVREEAQKYHNVNISYSNKMLAEVPKLLKKKGMTVTICSAEDLTKAEAHASVVWHKLAKELGPEAEDALAAAMAAVGKK